MDIYEAIRTRRSVRSYKSDPIPEDVLSRVLEAMRLAPSGCNAQPWKFIIVRDEELRKQLVGACRGQTFVGEAPVIIVGCGWEDKAYPSMGGYWNSLPVDIAIALDHLSLAAASEGLGTCWIGAFDEGEVKRILGIPNDVRVISLMTLGYPASISGKTGRKPLDEIICYDRWSS